MSKLLPLGDYVLIDAVETTQTTKSGIILPESKDKPSKGVVISVGSGKVLDSGNMSPISVKEGDVVYFKTYAPDELTVDDKKYLVIEHSALLAVEVN